VLLCRHCSKFREEQDQATNRTGISDLASRRLRSCSLKQSIPTRDMTHDIPITTVLERNGNPTINRCCRFGLVAMFGTDPERKTAWRPLNAIPGFSLSPGGRSATSQADGSL